jgi:RsiW-degrading membrane proteinase PrsW (M82 family)
MNRLRHLEWLWTLVVGGILFAAVHRAFVSTENPNFLPVLILLGAAVVPVGFVRFILQRDLGYRVRPALVLRVALVGGVLGVVAAGVLEYRTVPHLQVLPMVGVALIEETAKLIAPVAVLVFTRNRTRADGLLLGVAAGAGFAALETMGYAFMTLTHTSGDLSAVDGILALRGLFSPAAHMAWTGVAAAGLWYAVTHEGGRRTWWRFVGAFGLAVTLHASWNSTSSRIVDGLLAVVSLTFLLGIVRGLHRAHVRDVAVAAADPVFPAKVPDSQVLSSLG